MQSSNKLFALLKNYLKKYDLFRFDPRMTINRSAHFEGKEAYLNAKYKYAKSQHNLPLYMEKMLEVLEMNFDVLTPADQLNKMHTFFDDLDIMISSGQQNAFDERFLGHNVTLTDGEAFINASFFWKSIYEKMVKDARDSNTASHSFKTFGLLPPDIGHRVIDLTAFFEDEVGVINPFKSITKLKVGLFPLSKEYGVDFKITRMTNPARNTVGFIADNSASEENKSELKRAIEIILEMGIQIACLPEMVLSEELVVYLKAQIQLNPPNLLILVAGTYHKSRLHGGYQNTMPILIVHHGKIYDHLEYSKMEAFDMKFSGLTKASTLNNDENLKSIEQICTDHQVDFHEFIKVCNLKEESYPNREILILSCRGIGNLGFLICKDMVIKHSGLLESYERFSDHLFISSYNFEADADFKAKARSMSEAKRISSFYVNARAVDPLDMSPTFYYIPKKQAKLTGTGEDDIQERVIKKTEEPNLREIDAGEEFLVFELDLPKVVEYF